jgi:hypothetical protein
MVTFLFDLSLTILPVNAAQATALTGACISASTCRRWRCSQRRAVDQDRSLFGIGVQSPPAGTGLVPHRPSGEEIKASRQIRSLNR